MARPYRLSPDEALTRRIDSADARPGAVIDGADSFSRSLALLGTADISADKQDGRRAVARFSMYRRHGCKAGKCGHPAHAADRALRDELLDVLGLGGDGR